MSSVWELYVSNEMKKVSQSKVGEAAPNPIKSNYDYVSSEEALKTNSPLQKADEYTKGVEFYQSYLNNNSEDAFKNSINLLHSAYSQGSVNAAHYLSEIYYNEGDYALSNVWLNRAISPQQDKGMTKAVNSSTDSQKQVDAVDASNNEAQATNPMQSLLRLARALKQRGDYEAMSEICKVINKLAEEQSSTSKCDECFGIITRAEAKDHNNLCKTCSSK